MAPYDEIRTARLLLRRWRPEDREPFAALGASPAVMRHFPSTLTREQSDAFVDRIEAHFAEHGYGLWVVEVDGELAGFTGLMWQQGLPVDPALEVGWRFAERFWNHGYATEAARAALEVGLEVTPQVISVTAVTNERSWRVMERLGLERVQEFDHPRVEKGHPLERHYLYATP
ncbi:MAG: acetyltransferase, family protein [Frankiales bacterium]|nr:acetyltransferase, family protein [Frankiales bacterium]